MGLRVILSNLAVKSLLCQGIASHTVQRLLNITALPKGTRSGFVPLEGDWVWASYFWKGTRVVGLLWRGAPGGSGVRSGWAYARLPNAHSVGVVKGGFGEKGVQIADVLPWARNGAFWTQPALLREGRY
jgi:hypothetical protein